MSAAEVTGFRFALIYVEQLQSAQAFYERYLGFTKTEEFGPGEIFGRAGAIEIWMGEGYSRSNSSEKSVRATVMIGVESVGRLFAELKLDGQPVIQDGPVEMRPGIFFLQFADPSGNIIEVLGGE